MKIFSVKFGGVASFGGTSEQSAEVFFPSKVSRYMVAVFIGKASLHRQVTINRPINCVGFSLCWVSDIGVI